MLDDNLNTQPAEPTPTPTPTPPSFGGYQPSAPTPSVAPVSPASQPATLGARPPKNRKKRALIIVAELLLVCTVAGVVVFLLAQSTRPEPAAKPAPLTTLSAVGDTLKGAVEAHPDISVLTAQSGNPSVVLYRSAPGVWVANTQDDETLSFSSRHETSEQNKRDVDQAIEALSSVAFSEVVAVDSAPAQYSTSAAMTRYYSSEHIICTLRNLPEEKAYLLHVSCAYAADFTEAAKAVTPFAELYAATETTTQDVLFGAPDIQKSATENYQTARLSMASLNDSTTTSTALFYQIGDETWHYFTTTDNQAAVACSSYSSDDVQKAFIGFTCLDTATNTSSFVQTQAPTFEIEAGAIGG